MYKYLFAHSSVLSPFFFFFSLPNATAFGEIVLFHYYDLYVLPLRAP